MKVEEQLSRRQKRANEVQRRKRKVRRRGPYKGRNFDPEIARRGRGRNQASPPLTQLASKSASLSSSQYVDANPLSFQEMMGDEMIDICVGPRQELFRVYKLPLCRKIEHFNKLLNGDDGKSPQSSILLPNDNVEAFDLLVGWAITGSVRRLPVPEEGMRTTYAEIYNRILFYGLAERLGLSSLLDVIMNMSRENDQAMDQLPGVNVILDIFENTSIGSPYRRYACRVVQFRLAAGWPVSKVQELIKANDEFAVDFLELVRSGAEPSDPREADACEFHCHRLDQLCSAQG